MYEPSPKHSRLTKKVSRLLSEWMPFCPFLWEWQITVKAVEKVHDEIDACLAVEYAEYNMSANILVGLDALELSDYELEEGLLHEICHIFMHEVSMVFNNELKTLGGNPKYEHSAWQDAEERACWRFARMHMLRKTNENKNRN